MKSANKRRPSEVTNTSLTSIARTIDPQICFPYLWLHSKWKLYLADTWDTCIKRAPTPWKVVEMVISFIILTKWTLVILDFTLTKISIAGNAKDCSPHVCRFLHKFTSNCRLYDLFMRNLGGLLSEGKKVKSMGASLGGGLIPIRFTVWRGFISGDACNCMYFLQVSGQT